MGFAHCSATMPSIPMSSKRGGQPHRRGPVWMPVNALLIRALLGFYLYHGDNFRIECPTRSGNLMNLFEVAREIANRLTRIFLRDASGVAMTRGKAMDAMTDTLNGDGRQSGNHFASRRRHLADRFQRPERSQTRP
jgi:hypothetical protein